MELLRTPDERFADLPDYPYEPRYVDVDGIRMAYVDEGPQEAPPVLLLHGEPSWGYLYRSMVGPLVEAGLRAVVPDLVGFGRSDKPARVSDYSYQRHVDWMTAFVERLDLTGVTLFCQDWGSLIGLRVAAEQEHRFSRIVVANGFLPAGQGGAPLAFRLWRAFALHTPVFPVGRIVDVGTSRKLSPRERAAYDAPFPSSRHKAGARAFPALVPTDDTDPALPANRAAWEVLGSWEKPFLTLFGAQDPILGHADRPLQEHVPGAHGQPHARLPGSHFVQEDQGPELARRTIELVHSTPGA